MCPWEGVTFANICSPGKTNEEHFPTLELIFRMNMRFRQTDTYAGLCHAVLAPDQDLTQ